MLPLASLRSEEENYLRLFKQYAAVMETCNLHGLPGALLLNQKKYDVAHVVIDMYIPKKFHGFISFGFWLKKPHSPIHL